MRYVMLCWVQRIWVQSIFSDNDIKFKGIDSKIIDFLRDRVFNKGYKNYVT